MIAWKSTVKKKKTGVKMVISPLIQQISVVQRAANNGHAIAYKEVLWIFKRKIIFNCVCSLI